MPTDITNSLRAEVVRRADRRCEYCLIREEDTGFPHQVDHIISRKHGGGDQIEPLTGVGRVTVELLRLNTADRLSERRLLQALGDYPAH